MENYIFWSEIGSGFGEPGGTPPPRIPRHTSPKHITCPAQERLATPMGSTSPILSKQWCRFFHIPQEPYKWKCSETKPMVFRPLLRRLESHTVCRCHYIGSTFFSVILKPWVLVWIGFGPMASCSVDWCSLSSQLTRHRLLVLYVLCNFPFPLKFARGHAQISQGKSLAPRP